VLERKRPEIDVILKQYNIPVLPIAAEAQGKSAADTRKKAGPG